MIKYPFKKDIFNYCISGDERALSDKILEFSKTKKSYKYNIKIYLYAILFQEAELEKKVNYQLNLGAWSSIFAVPTAVVDNYIKTASGENLKILLFLLRNAEKEINNTVVASALGLSEEQVEDGITFWQQRKIIAKDGVNYKPSDAAEQTVIKENDKNHLNLIKSKSQVLRTPDFSPMEISKTIRGSNEADYLFKRCEELFGRNLKHNEQNTLMIILEDIRLPVGVTLLLVEYCFSIDKASPAYLRSISLDWAERGITTLEGAEIYISELKSLSGAEQRFRKLFGVNSAFSKQQSDFIITWTGSYGFSDEMINEAYQLTLNATGKLSFPYMNKILTGWRDKGIKSPEQISKIKPKDPEKQASSFDINEIERLEAQKFNL